MDGQGEFVLHVSCAPRRISVHNLLMARYMSRLSEKKLCLETNVNRSFVGINVSIRDPKRHQYARCYSRSSLNSKAPRFPRTFLAFIIKSTLSPPTLPTPPPPPPHPSSSSPSPGHSSPSPIPSPPLRHRTASSPPSAPCPCPAAPALCPTSPHYPGSQT